MRKKYIRTIEGILDNLDYKFEKGLNINEKEALRAGLGDSWCDDLDSYFLEYMRYVYFIISTDFNKMCQSNDDILEEFKNYIILLKKIKSIRDLYRKL